MPRRSPCSRQAAGVARSEAGGRGAGGAADSALVDDAWVELSFFEQELSGFFCQNWSRHQGQ